MVARCEVLSTLVLGLKANINELLIIPFRKALMRCICKALSLRLAISFIQHLRSVFEGNFSELWEKIT